MIPTQFNTNPQKVNVYILSSSGENKHLFIKSNSKSRVTFIDSPNKTISFKSNAIRYDVFMFMVNKFKARLTRT